MSPRPALFRAAAVAGASALTLAAVSGPAAAATGDDVSVVNTETVQAYTDASGEVESQRIYEQLHFTGEGATSVENPAVLEGLRNLDGFGGFDTKDGEQFVEVDVDGTEDVRTVSDYEGDLPLDIAVTYTLDGKRVEPADLVGATGDLEVEYTSRTSPAASRPSRSTTARARPPPRTSRSPCRWSAASPPCSRSPSATSPPTRPTWPATDAATPR